MKNINLLLTTQLTEIGCASIPENVRAALLEDLEATLLSSAKKRLCRLTARKVAKVFGRVAGAPRSGEKGVKGGTPSSTGTVRPA